MGDLSEILEEVKTHNEKASAAQDSALAVGVKKITSNSNQAASTLTLLHKWSGLNFPWFIPSVAGLTPKRVTLQNF